MIVRRLFLWEVVIGLFGSAAHLTAEVAAPVSLAWNASPSADVASYVVRYGTTSGVYSGATNVGNRTAAQVTGLQAGQTYYLAVTARNTAGLESLPSNEASYQPPAAALPVITLTSPSATEMFAAPATINGAASVTANGHAITKVQFWNGGTMLSEDTSAPYSFVWNNVSAGTYLLQARAVYGSGSTVDSALTSITVTALPAPWQTVDIGTVGLPGSASQSNSVYTLRGAGRVAGTADSFRFVYQPLSANGEIRARLTSVTTNNLNGSFGVMIRESLSPNSKYAFMGVGPDLRFRWQRRSSSGGSTATTTSTASTPPNTWVRLVRSSSTLTGYKSGDGTNWTKVSSRSISMAANVSVGLVVASGNTNALNTATFANTFVVP